MRQAERVKRGRKGRRRERRERKKEECTVVSAYGYMIGFQLC